MPIRERIIKDEKGNPVIDPETNEPKVEVEKFLPHFLGDTEAEATATLKEYEKTMKILADKFHMITGLDADDLKSECMIGLARAKRDFEEERSEMFRTFAIYKMKDALREFTTKQMLDVKVPQYVKDAEKLINDLAKLVEACHVVKNASFRDIWLMSEACDGDKNIQKDIERIRESLTNLANRSHTSVIQLLERAEMLPSSTIEITDHNVSNISIDTHEDGMLDKLNINETIKKLKNFLTEDEYKLLYDYYVNGKTERELAVELGIKAPSVHIRLHNTLTKVKEHKKEILTDGSDQITEEAE